MHLNTFTEICDMMCIKDVDPDAVKLRLFPFSLRGRAKEWLLSLPKNTISSWVECTSLFMTKFFPNSPHRDRDYNLRNDITQRAVDRRRENQLSGNHIRKIRLEILKITAARGSTA